jgi:uncharacterized membrane protein YuzA (DUF378 family)
MHKTKMLIIAAAVIAVVLLPEVIHAKAAGLQPGSILQSLPISPASWLGIAFAVILLMIAISAVVYMLAGLAGVPEMRGKAMGQIHEGILAMIMLLAFGAFAYLFFINPYPAFSGAGLAVSTCNSANSIYALSACEIGAFSNNAFNAVEGVFYLSFLSGVAPGFSVKFNTPLLPGVGSSATLDSVVPISEERLLGTAFSALFIVLMLNQIQVILISASLLFLGFFLTIGLISRSFAATRTFGGSLIAFGLGLGLIYPLIVSISYGFINVQIGAAGINPGVIAADFFGGFVGGAITLLTGGTLSSLSSLVPYLTQIIYVIVGLTFIPFMNFIILNSFIRDFSKVIGEQVEFMALITGLM